MKDTIKISDKKGVKIVAHRGLSGLEAENTAAAFVAAGNRSYYGIETDIHRTADGKFVAIHDDTTSRVAKKKAAVNKLKYEDIAAGVRLNGMDDDLGPRADLVPPLLEDYISVCRRYGKHSVLELKDGFTLPELEKIIKIIDKAGHLKDTTFITFVPENIYGLRDILPNQSVQALTDRVDDMIMEGIVKYNVDIDVLFRALDEEKVKLLKSHGKIINCWTVDSLEDASRMIDLGVDFITSNILE